MGSIVARNIVAIWRNGGSGSGRDDDMTGRDDGIRGGDATGDGYVRVVNRGGCVWRHRHNMGSNDGMSVA